MQYKLTAVGGTFDRLHKGHREILNKAFAESVRVLIGVTSDKMAGQKPLASIGQTYVERVGELEKFLVSKNYLKRATIIPIDDIYGPAIKNKDLEAIIVSSETASNAGKINQERKHRGLPLLAIISIQTVKGIDNKRIASRRIRGGEEDREGIVYLSKKLKLFPYRITKNQRKELKKPLGVLIQENEKGEIPINILKSKLTHKHIFVITVGDKITKSCIDAGVLPTIGIIDLKIRRKKVFKSVKEIYKNNTPHVVIIGNPRGTVTRTLAESVSSLVKKAVQRNIQPRFSRPNFCIQVRGEEDLAALPAILFAPLGSLVLYGQPPIGNNPGGVVIVEVTEKRKQEVIHFVKHRYGHCGPLWREHVI